MKDPLIFNPSTSGFRSQSRESEPGPEAVQAFLRGELNGDAAERVASFLEANPEQMLAATEAIDKAAGMSLEDDVRDVERLKKETQVDIAPPLPRIRQWLSDYEIEEEIGRGGMGVVYRARHVKLNRDVAIKIMPALLGAVRPQNIERFRREASLAAQLKHGNIIAIHDYGEVDGMLFYTMDLIDGPSLRDILTTIQETGAVSIVIEQPSANGSGNNDLVPNPVTRSSDELETSHAPIGSNSRIDRAYYRRIASWMADVAEALQYAHAQAIIHRDVKPSNLLVGSDGRLIVTDFGLAKSRQHPSVTGNQDILGTIRYMSPEQLDPTRGTVDARTDVYALGATLYELLCFRPIADGGDQQQLIRQIHEGLITPPRRWVRQIPWELETICLKAVETDREDRYESAQAMADDLRRFLLDVPITARPPTLFERTRKLIRRRKLPVMLGTLAFLLLVSGGVVTAKYKATLRRAAIGQRELREAKIRAYLDQGEKLRNQGRFAEALEIVEQGILLDPESFELMFLRGSLLGDLRRNEDALAVFRALAERDGENPFAHLRLAMAYYSPFSRGHESIVYRPHDCYSRIIGLEACRKLAEQHHRRLARLRPKSPEVRFLDAIAEPDTDTALKILDDLLMASPNHMSLLIERAAIHELSENYTAALSDLTQAAALAPGNPRVFGIRGRILLRINRAREAVESFDKAIELNRTHPYYWQGRGIAHRYIGQLEKAIADLAEAIRLDPTFADAYCDRAVAKQGLGELDHALADCNEAIRLKPNRPDFHQRRISINGQADRWQEVIADCNRILQIEPNNVDAYNDRAVAHRQLGNPSRVAADLGRVIELDSQRDSAFRSRALALRQMGEYELALADIDRAIQINTRKDDFRIRAGINIALGKYQLAASDLCHVIHQLPSYIQGVMLRGMVYEILNANELALSDFSTAAESKGSASEYARLWKYLLLVDMHRDHEAVALLNTLGASDLSNIWIQHLVRFFKNEITSEALLANAATDDERCEAYYYIGRKALAEGEYRMARKSLESCVGMKRNGLLESTFAGALLRVKLRFSEDSRRHSTDPAGAP